MDTYTIQRESLVQDLINTYDLYLDDPEHLHEPHDLQHFLETRGIRPAATITQVDLEETHLLRERLRTAWTTSTTADMLRILNPLIEAANVTMQFEEDTEQHIHAHFELEAGIPIVQRLAFECALGMIDVVQEHGRERMRACAADPCQDVFVDTSRNNSRRFCSDRCANRYNISAFRGRQKGTK